MSKKNFKLFFFVLSLNEKFLIDFNLIKIFFNESEDNFIKRVKTTDGWLVENREERLKLSNFCDFKVAKFDQICCHFSNNFFQFHQKNMATKLNISRRTKKIY